MISTVYNIPNNSVLYYVSCLNLYDTVFPSIAVYGQSFYHDRASMKIPKYTYMDIFHFQPFRKTDMNHILNAYYSKNKDP